MCCLLQHDAASYSQTLLSAATRSQLIFAAITAAKIWTTWELMTAHLIPNEENIDKGNDDKFSLAFARIENHYFFNRGFLPSDSHLLDNIDKIRHIKTVIVQVFLLLCWTNYLVVIFL
ncbi:Proline iminopeptidase [Platanthera guangdongensis]|uniref:Proline iminopeptidase n=1 Tax=Platanthera guangdongensis TaxID=2320717 RepID=A0ABR2LD72_9ASPA